MIAIELTAEQRAAVDVPFDRCCAIVGAAGTGKTTALFERVARARIEFPNGDPAILAQPRDVDDMAFELLHECGAGVRRVDDAEAQLLFEKACAPLFSLEWEEFSSELDPEVPGLRSPERFLESAFRLIRRLREATITPEAFLERALAGAMQFAAKPPNFADPALIFSTKSEHHDSLDVSPQELQRQYRREVDLAKILAKLYRRYDDLTDTSGLLTGRDAVARAAALARNDPNFARRRYERHQTAFVDGADELTAGRMALLEAIFGPALAGVTLATAAPLALPHGATTVELREQHRSPLAIELAVRTIVRSPDRLDAHGVEPALELYRGRAQRDEAAFVAERVAGWLADGTPADRIAVLLRSVRRTEPYESALLDRNVPITVVGDVNVFEDRRCLDALALLWNVHDPFRHDWMLRTLANPAFALSDATLAALCSEPPHPQTPLFVLDDEQAPSVRSSRWDPKRDLRLGWNVVRGEQDAALEKGARATIERFRALREGWLEALRDVPFETFVRRAWREGLALDGVPGSARARAQQTVLHRLLGRLLAFRDAEPDATFADVLAYAEYRMSSELESCEDGGDAGGVRLMSVEAARGHEFDRVVVANVRAGAFPCWYVPDAFLFSPRAGMIPKENAGDARAARTAKFSYYMHRNKPRERFNERERRLFVDALRRARRGAAVTSFGSPTRGVAAPEFFEELRAAGPPGTTLA
ncbi:MAG: ATP-dependent helicase [Candidatus Eremiobacteraeota bacterium]|nr:ATP-dependent helicase [Candidatus Eremiobacteraeota bacterium]